MVGRIRVKICGLTTTAAVAAAVDAGADALGVVMSPSPRQLDLQQAKQLLHKLPPWTAAVAVTRQPPENFVGEVLPQLAPAWWQSDLADFNGITAPAGIHLLPVIRAGEDASNPPDYFVYEGVESGRGETVDWDTAAVLARKGRMILAGGLNPDNVGAAISTVRPYGVDVSSGVESARGVKDPGLIRAFIAAVRQAEAQ